MDAFTEYLNSLPEYLGIILLMLSTFLLGYFSSSQLLRLKYRKTINRLKREVNTLKTAPSKNERDIDTIFTEMEPKIMKMVKEQQEILSESKTEERIKSASSFAERNKDTYIKERKGKEQKGIIEDEEESELDFDSFGYADAEDRDDLTQINGIGPYIEQKLNDVGIYTYEQISNLSLRDIDLLTEMIDFFPGRIERDNWVGQAKSLKVY